MDAIIRFLQDTGFYLFSQDGNWRCLIMLGIACVLLYLGIVKKFGYLEKMVVFDLSSRFKSKSTLFLLVVFCSITGILY